MKKLIFIFSVFILFGCKPKLGTISGNVFWKYNDYVGNKPDAGSRVVIYQQSDTTIFRKHYSTADVDGNFKFDNLPIGNYLVVVSSKNVHGNQIEYFDKLILHSYYLRNYFNYDYGQKVSGLMDSFNYFKKKPLNFLFNMPLSLENKFEDFIPEDLKYSLPTPLFKYYIDEVKVKDKIDTKIVIDFGINDWTI